jgi:hypothetical protein
MKRAILALVLAVPSLIFGQYVQFPRYESEHTAKHIMMGDIKSFCQDTVEFVVEKSNDRWVTSYLNPGQVSKKVWKVLQRGKSQFTGSTSRGYVFYITVFDVNDDTIILGGIHVYVNIHTLEIEKVEILR